MSIQLLHQSYFTGLFIMSRSAALQQQKMQVLLKELKMRLLNINRQETSQENSQEK